MEPVLRYLELNTLQRTAGNLIVALFGTLNVPPLDAVELLKILAEDIEHNWKDFKESV